MSGKNKKNKKNLLITVIIIICMVVAAFAAYKIITISLGYKQGQEEYEKLRQYTFAAQSSSSKEEEDEKKTETVDTSGISKTAEEDKPPIEVDFESLKAINPDFACWLYLGAENISYPVVHYSDNDYYLHRTFEGNENYAGTLFIECQNKGDLTDPNTLIYGHNMKDTSMFGKLKLLQEEEDYKEDDSFWLLTEEASYKYKIFSMQVTDESSDVYTLFSGPMNEVVDYILNMAQNSLVQFPLADYDENSRVVTLSTCMTANTTERFVVQGILVDVIER